MSRIDFAAVITAEDKAAEEREARRAAARAECRRRILAVCGETTQLNLAAAAAARELKGPQPGLYRALLAWISAMRARWPELAETGADPADPVNWPAVPEGVAGLVVGF